MKKIICIFFVFWGLNTILYGQQNNIMSSHIDLDSIRICAKEKTNLLLAQYDFLINYKTTFETRFFEFEQQKQLIILQHSDSDQREAMIQLAKSKLNLWKKKEVSTIKKATLFWKKTASRYDLDERGKDLYIQYHYYLYHAQTSSLAFQQKKTALSTSKQLGNIAHSIAQHETERVMAKCSAVRKLEDPAMIIYGRKQLSLYLTNIMDETLKNLQEITLTRNSDLYCDYAETQVKKKEKEQAQEQAKRKDRSFLAKAKKNNIDSTTARTILEMISKRKMDLEALKNKQMQVDGMSELFENTNLKTKSEIKAEFAQKLAVLIDKRQFAKLFGHLFFEHATQKANAQLLELKKTAVMKEEELEEISKMVKTYYFNKEVYSAYYAYDKRLKKQKLGALHYRFEKDYQELITRLDLKINPSTKINNNTYLWN